MGSSQRRRRAIGLALLALVACNAGTGTGMATGTIRIAMCRDTDTPYSLDPTFFSAEGSLSSLHIRLQRGSNVTGDSDGVWIDVADASGVAHMLDAMDASTTPSVTLPLGDPAAAGSASMTLYLGETCNTSYRDVAAVLPSVSGNVTFSAIYDPANSGSQTAITGHFDDVLFQDPADPAARHAMLSGTFDFIYNRGRPAQRFP